VESAASSADDFAQLFEATFARLQVAILDACGREVGWSAKVAAGMQAGFDLAAADPVLVRTLTNDALARGVDGIVRYERLVSYLGERLAPGRAQRPEGSRLPETTERAMAGGVLTLVAQRVDRGRVGELGALVPEAIQFVLTPYLGAEEARRVALDVERPASG
jgi:hypothetical protein